MLRLRLFPGRCLRPFHRQAILSDEVLKELKACSAEEQVFNVVDRNEAKLSVSHVNCAIGLLWKFQIVRPEILRTLKLTQSHPQFLTLRVLAENNISVMDDCTLVDIFYNLLRLNVQHHDTLMQQLVMEAWRRLERLPMGTLSKFAVCLIDMNLQHSPLMGDITHIVSQRLDTIHNAKVLTPLMVSICALVSPQLRDSLIKRAEILLDRMDPFRLNNTRRVVQFIKNSKLIHKPLLDKCNQFLLQNIYKLNMDDIGIITGLQYSLHYSSNNLKVAMKQRLMELMDGKTNPDVFTKLFCCLGPIAGQGVREELESTALLLANELNSHQALVVLVAMGDMQCRNLQLINKMESVVYKNLEQYRLLEITRVTQALIQLHCQNPKILSRLKAKLLNYLQSSVYPYEVAVLIKVLSMLPSRRLDDGVLSRVNAMLPQCSLINLNTYTSAVARWIRSDLSYRINTPSKYVQLLQTLNRCGRERLDHLQGLDATLEEVKYMSGEWFEEILLEKSIVTMQKMIDQISWTNVPELAVYLNRNNYLCTALLDRIASVTVENIDKIHYFDVYTTLLPYALLNYDPPGVEKFFDTCIQHIIPHIGSFDPHVLVLMTHALATANYFPKEMIREIFTVDFLTKLDAHIETFSDNQNLQIRQRLMQLNRAVCLECPEFHVPWFHERYCQQHQKKANSSISSIQKQIHRILGEVLGGINCAKIAVVTPYYYTVDFELVLDRNLHPLPYSEPTGLQTSDGEKVHRQSGSAEKESTELPPGARRIALDFLYPRSFCRNSRHMKGEAVMKKRHLEILGYHVLQIPHFEWNSMELSTDDAWKQYLKEKIFTALP